MAHDLSFLTWEDAREAIRRNTIVVVPTGAHEQHGRHLPLGTDAMLVTALTHRAVEIVSAQVPILLTPTLWLGFSPHHMDFPGSISLSASTYLNVVADVCRSLWSHGFRRLVIVNGHGGNAAPLRTLVQELRGREGIRVAMASYWDLAASAIRDWRRSEIGGINHACEMETALMLHLHGEVVRMEKAVRHIPPPVSSYLSRDLLAPGRAVVGSRTRDVSASGAVGDPTVATAERGSELFEAIVTELARFLQEVNTWEAPADVTGEGAGGEGH